MTIVRLHDFVKVSISASFKSFLSDAPESTNKFSFLKFQRWCRQAPIFPEDEKNVALSCSFNLNTFFASFHAASRASNLGALGLRSWGSTGQIIPSEGLWSRIFAWRANGLCEFHTLGLVSACLCSSGKLMTTSAAPYPERRKPNCRVLDELHTTGPVPLHVTCVTKKQRVFVVLSYNSCFFSMATALLSPFFFGPFARLFVNLAMCIRALFSKSATTLGLVEQAFWRVPLFHKQNWCKFLLR